MQIDHLGIAVRSVEAAADRLGTVLGYERKTTKVHNTRQRVNVLFLRKAGSLDLKLIEPADDQSPLVDFVRKGGGLHHLCFKVPDVAQACRALSGLGARVLAAPAPGEAFDDHPIAFVYVGSGLNVELIDTDLRRDIIDEIAR
jgi:methylmalonyl-CoA/ethylmalonyl-CoA epimerase